jgi:hypothetical protein
MRQLGRVSGQDAATRPGSRVRMRQLDIRKTAASHDVQQNSPAKPMSPPTGTKIRSSPQSAHTPTTPLSIKMFDLLSMTSTVPERADSLRETRPDGSLVTLDP